MTHLKTVALSGVHPIENWPFKIPYLPITVLVL